jgi:hypothetical protein
MQMNTQKGHQTLKICKHYFGLIKIVCGQEVMAYANNRPCPKALDLETIEMVIYLEFSNTFVQSKFYCYT